MSGLCIHSISPHNCAIQVMVLLANTQADEPTQASDSPIANAEKGVVSGYS